MAYAKKRSDSEITERIIKLKSNINSIQNIQGREIVNQTINILETFKDKSEEEIVNEITKDKSIKNKTLKWMVSLLE